MTSRLLLPVLLILLSVLAPAAAAAQVRGHVTDAATADPVVGALVWLTGRTIHLARSSRDGGYEFTDAPPGSYCIRVDSPGYEGPRVCISVSANARMIVDLPLAVRPVAIAPLVVTGRRGMVQRGGADEDPLQPALTIQDLAIPAIRTSALAAAQLGDLTHMPGMDRAAGGRPHALYVWGSSADRGRVLLDGASLNAPLHLGALLPPLDPDMIAAADVHSGGISPRYDGGTSYIMDFTTRPASDESRTWGELDLLAGRLGAETPIGGRGGVVVSARRVNDEIIDGLVTSDFGYGYADVLARADVDLGRDNGVHLTALTTREAVSIPRDLADDRASWHNRAGTLVWRRGRRDDVRSATASVSRGVADLPLLSAVGGHLEATLDRYGGLVQRHWRSGELNWHAGAELEHLVFRRRSRAIQDPATGEPNVECTASLPCSHSNATLASMFTEVSMRPLRGVRARVGVRAMYDIDAQHLHMLPRASLTLLPSQHYSIVLAAGRFSQAYVRETPLWSESAHVDVPIDVDVARATHLELGIARHVGASYLRAGAYLRRHARVEPTTDARTVPGADVSLEQGTPHGVVSIAYNISGMASARDDSTRGAGAQHLATAGFSGQRGRWQLDLNAAYGSGLPLTSIVLEQPVDAEVVLDPAPDSGEPARRSERSYLRLDASLGAEWRLGSGGGIRLTPYARIINALGQRESLFYFQDNDLTSPPRGLARLPAVPMIGVRWQF